MSKEESPVMSDEPRHAVQVVSKRTGLSPDALRVWERRHGAVSPGRSAGRQRLYSDADIHRLHVLRRLTLSGHRIGHVAALPLAELEQLLREDVPVARAAPGAAAYLATAMDAVRRLDVRESKACLESAAAELGSAAFVDDFVMPLLRQVGEAWHAKEISPAHEHALSVQLESLLQDMVYRLDAAARGPEIIVSTPVGQRHGLAALAVAVVAAAADWRVAYLGVDLPGEDLLGVMRERGAKALALSLVHSSHAATTDRFLREVAAGMPSGTTLIVGGAAAAAHGGVLDELGALQPSSLDELREELSRLADS